jgi:integrase/recombinase XerD
LTRKSGFRIARRLVGMRRIGEQNAVFCSRILFWVNGSNSLYFLVAILVPFMSGSLFDRGGTRKYLVARERLSFVAAAVAEGGAVGAFCLTLIVTGARISEVLALRQERIDTENDAIIFETLKQRRKLVFRAVPAPHSLLQLIRQTSCVPGQRVWPWGRTTAWKIVKSVMTRAGITGALCKPKALRHTFAVEATLKSVPLNIVQRWLGHSRLETTAIYASALGDEERNFAKRAWDGIEHTIHRCLDAEIRRINGRQD